MLVSCYFSAKEITIQANITTIYNDDFGNEYTPSVLKEVHFKSTTPPSMLYDYKLSDSGLPSNCKIYVR